MIRTIIAFLLIFSALISILFGVHPRWAVIMLGIGVFLLGWACVDQLENDKALVHK